MIDTEPQTDPTRRQPKDRRVGRIVLPVLIVLLVLAALGLSRFYSWATGASGPRTPVVVQIPEGATGSQVADLLQRRHVIRSAFGFRILARVKHSSAFEAGRYRLTTNMTASEALAVLEEPPTVPQVRLTVPEGFDVQQTARRVASVLRIGAVAFETAATSGAFQLPGYMPPETGTVEGFLFPDTYFLYEDATPKDVIDVQLGQFQQVAADLRLTERSKALHLTPFQLVTVASMIEEEAKFQKDRVRVAEVIYNRLRRRMPLQIDATTAYAVGKLGRKLTAADYRSKSPYNTYTHVGLPPGPISNPGADSLRAALNPAGGDLLYYVVIDAAGHEAFTASYSEFLRLKASAP
jgi:UPF0755 protein